MSLANGFSAGGHEVAVGTRDATKPSLAQWVADGHLALGQREATEWAELVCLAVPGRLVRQTVLDIGPAAFGDKIVIDVTNPVLVTEDSVEAAYGEDSSAAEVVQAALPDARVVKALNQIAAPDMLAPDTSKGPRHMRICGNDQAAKAAVAELLAPFGWEVTDLGSVERARDLEATTLRWIRSQRS
jgi:8-hydroxy-5-deazaflavin:NADPH oxidoreductase